MISESFLNSRFDEILALLPDNVINSIKDSWGCDRPVIIWDNPDLPELYQDIPSDVLARTDLYMALHFYRITKVSKKRLDFLICHELAHDYLGHSKNDALGRWRMELYNDPYSSARASIEVQADSTAYDWLTDHIQTTTA